MELCASPRPNTSSTCHWASSFCCSACLPGLCSRQVVKKGALRDTQAPEMTGSACQATIGLSAAWRARRVFGRRSPVFIYPFGFLICHASPTRMSRRCNRARLDCCQGRACAAVAGVAGTGRFGVGRRATRRTGARPEETGRELVVMATSSITWWGRWRGGSSRSAHTHSRCVCRSRPLR